MPLECSCVFCIVFAGTTVIPAGEGGRLGGSAGLDGRAQRWGETENGCESLQRPLYH